MSCFSTVCLGKLETVSKNSNGPKIKYVRAFVPGSKELEESSGGCGDYHSQSKGHWIVDSMIANPMSMFPEYKQSRTSWGINALGTIIVEVELDNGLKGVGVSIGGDPACFIVENNLSRFIEGQDPNNIELMWEQMWKSTMNYGRKGLTLQAISAVDLALWDVLGKLRNEPVYNLLGGKTKERIPIYATTARPDYAKKMGFVGAKVPLPYGPADGDKGMKLNVEFIAKWREEVGPDFPLMVDCYMSLNVRYTIELATKLSKYNVKWLEECLVPDDYDGWKQIRSQIPSDILLTTGEHEYSKYGYKKLLETKSVDILQPDISWCGGITEARKIYAMASSYDIPVIPHGSSVYSYHLQMANFNCPMAEFLIMSPKADEIVPLFGNTFLDEPLPKNGYIELSNKPGFGVTLNYEGLNLKRPYARLPKF